MVRAYQRVAAADDRRAVGHRDQPAHPARREPSPPRRPDRCAGAPRTSWRTSWPMACWPSVPTAPRSPRRAFRRLSRSTLPTAASVQLFQRLRDQDPAVTPALAMARGAPRRCRARRPRRLVRLEHQRQATMNVTVRNVITSMRLISWFDWAQFVESVSLVDDALRERSAFGDMDFATRDQLSPRRRGTGARLGRVRGRRRPAGRRDGRGPAPAARR